MTGPVELDAPDDPPADRPAADPAPAPAAGPAGPGAAGAAGRDEAERQTRAAVRSVSRLEESN